MIELINVSKYYPTEFGRHYVFRNVSLKLPLDKSVGVLGPNGAGKSTFLRLLGGADAPSEGRIIKTGSISPPMGLTPSLQSNLTASENMRFAGRIYGLERDEINETIEFVRNLTGIGKYFDLPVSTYSSGMRSRVAFAINISLSFDFYLFDEISAGGDKEFRKITAQMVEQRLKTSKFIVASHRVEELLELCDTGIIIQNGELTYFDSIKDAVAAYGDTEALENDKAKKIKIARRRAAQTAGDGDTTVAQDVPSAESIAEERRQRLAIAKAARLANARAARLAKLQQDQGTVVVAGDGATPALPLEAADREPSPTPRRRLRKAKTPTTDLTHNAAPTIAVVPPGGGDGSVPQQPASEAVGPESAKPDGKSPRVRLSRAKRRQARGLSPSEAPESASAAPSVAEANVHPIMLIGAATAISAKAEPARKRRRKSGDARGGALNGSPDLPADIPPEIFSDQVATPSQDAGKLLRRTLIYQYRAQVSAAEAIALLLEFSGRQTDKDGTADHAARVALLQQQASLEAANARALLNEILGGTDRQSPGKTRAGSAMGSARTESPSRRDAPAERPGLNR